MKQSLSYLFLCLFIFASCSPKMTTTLIKAQAPLEEDVEVKVFPPEAQAPESAVVLETITLVGLDYDQLVEMAKDQARQAGGNVLQIVKHLSPDISCPRNRMAAVALSTCDSLSTDAGSPQSFASELDLKDASKTIRIALQGGIAYRLGTRKMGLNTAIKQHVQNMKWGGLFGMDVTFFFSENYGLGLRFQDLYMADTMPVSVSDNSGNITSGYIEDYGNICFVGPAFTARQFSRNRNIAFYSRVGLGYLGYYDWGKAVKDSYTYFFSGFTLGILCELGVDLAISRHLSAGVSLTYIGGSLRDYLQTVNGVRQYVCFVNNNKENLSHIGLSIGLRYNL